MATTRIIPMHVNKGKTIAQCLTERTDYAKNPDKTEDGEYISAYACDAKTADSEFLLSKRQYRQLTGREQASDVIAYQIRQSFKPGEVTPEEANQLGYEFARRFTKGDHAFIVCTHTDKQHIHNHIIWNSTTLDCTRKFRNFWGSTEAVRKLSDLVCMEHRLSVIENPKPYSKSYNKWRGERAEPTQLEQVRSAIDAALSQKPANWDAFVALLAENGCEVKRRGKTLSFRGAGWERFIRADRLGADYLEAALLDAILGRQEHTPQRTAIIGAPRTPSLLIDIDAKIRAGKGVGYQRWASKFNAKQLGQTMTYLKEHDLMNYADLKKKTQAATEQFHALSAQIKSAEARMAEIAVLRGHIVNFAKTKKTFEAYKASGYTKKFLAEHEAEILLHRSAKRAFQELNVKKLPTVKSLQEEYAKLLSEKKAAYPDYRKAKQEMQELLIVQANVAKILGAEPREAEHEKEQKQR